MTNNKEPMNLGKLILANTIGRLITAAIGIGLLVVLVLVVGAFSGNNKSDGIDNSGVSVSSTESTEPSPANTDSSEWKANWTPEGYPQDSKAALLSNRAVQGEVPEMTDDEAWAFAVSTCKALDDGSTWKQLPGVGTEKESFMIDTVYKICPHRKDMIVIN